jgi:hypothetical protein
MLYGFNGAENGSAFYALPAPPDLIAFLLGSGINHPGFTAAMYTNHVNILTYSY